MDVDGIIVEGYYEVLALHRFILNYKFDDLASEYAGSPFIAAIQHRLYDALQAADPGKGWQEWRNADGHPHRVQAVRQYLATAGSSWTNLDTEQRTAYVNDLLAPLRLSDGLLGELVEIEVDPDARPAPVIDRHQV